jgi:crotonobetainyl-CoA:carnitine CoA-transferase CaiB-like acyl-CoA transferase
MVAGAHEVFNQVWREAEIPLHGDVEIEGNDPIFPVPFRVGDAGAATIAACGAMAAELWRSRSGRSQKVSVAVDAAAAAMRSAEYLRRDQASNHPTPRSIRGLQQDIYRTRDDRWVYLHRGFPHHRARIASVLDGADDHEALAAAVRRWDAAALEDAIVQAGACAGMVRSHDEWLAHGQGAAVERLPLLEVVRIGDSQPEAMPAGVRPLSGIRVIDVTRVLAGPMCARTLTEHGADVLRIGTTRLPNNELQNIDTGYGKRSTVLDLTGETGAGQLRTLIGDADVFSQGYRPGSMASRGLGMDDLAAMRPGIVYVQLSAFGHVGPWNQRRGFDTLVQVVSGMAAEYAQDGRPRLLPLSVLDYCTGYLAAFGVMVALCRRARDGGSYLVRVSLAQTARWVTGLGRIASSIAAGAPQDLSPERIDELCIEADTAYGRIRYLAPIAQLSETPAQWDRPAVPLGHDPPTWG